MEQTGIKGWRQSSNNFEKYKNRILTGKPVLLLDVFSFLYIVVTSSSWLRLTCSISDMGKGKDAHKSYGSSQMRASDPVRPTVVFSSNMEKLFLRTRCDFAQRVFFI